MRWDEESANIVREIVRSCKPGMNNWEKCQHVLLIRKFFLHALTKVPDRPDHVLWYWEDDNGVEWYLLKGNWDRTHNPFWGAGLVEDGNKTFPKDVHEKFNVQMASGGGFVGNIDFIRASTRAIQSDTPEAWLSAEDIWRKMYPLNSTLPLPTKGDADSLNADVLKNQCKDEIAKWALKHRTATENLARSRGFGNSGCLNGALEDLSEYCKWMRSTVSKAVDILVAGDLAKALAMIDTLKCGPAGCPMPQGSHNGDCLDIAKSRMKALLLAFPVQVPVKIQVSHPSANPVDIESTERSTPVKLPQKKRTRTRKGATPKWMTEALVLLQQNPNFSGSEVARQVGVAKSTLTQHRLWKAAIAQFQSHKSPATKFEKRHGIRQALSNTQSNEENDSFEKNS